MMHFYAGPARQSIARFLLLVTVCQISSPVVGWALTSGPVQPEFAGFASVNTKDLVNKFTGDFAYTLPLLDVPGPAGSSYPVTLGYRSGPNTEDEASWVGYGWNLNPGAINRNVRGLPDDFYNEELTYTNRTPENFTLTLGAGAGLELFSGDLSKAYKLGGLNANTAIRYNNHNGFGYEQGFGITLGKGLVSLNVQESDGRRTYSGRVNPMQLMATFQAQNYTLDAALRQEVDRDEDRFRSHTFAQNLNQSLHNSAQGALNATTSINVAGGNHGIIDFNEGSRSTVNSQYSGKSYNVTIGAAINPGPVPIGANFNTSASYSSQKAVETDKLPAYGYMYAGEANAEKNGDGPSRKRVANLLTDYYVEKDGAYEHRDIQLGIPFSNSDNYSVSGEGIGGGFQLQHSQVGEFGPNTKSSTTTIYNLGGDISLGWTFGAGAKASVGLHSLDESSWDEALGNKNNKLLPFSTLGTGSYFRFTNDMGGTSGEDLLNDGPVTAALAGGTSLSKGNLLALTGSPDGRPKQGTHIGQHTVAQAARPAMFRYCRRADIDALRERPKSGKSGGGTQNQAIAEFRVTNEGGQQYTYGLPMYAQRETTTQYGVQGTSAANIQQNYLVYSAEDKIKVGQTRDGAYATSYLLTEITGSDYVDRNLNGPDEADFGGYTTFSYVKTYGGKGAATNSWYRWRLPYTGQQYQMGSLSTTDDDMGAVSAGDKEISYLQAIHTKTHTAIFTVSSRLDGLEAADEISALQYPSVKGNAALSKLDRVDLYANSDVELVSPSGDPGDTRRIWAPKQNSTVVPLKSVQLTYDYSLCQQTPNSSSPNKGKLTLLQVKTFYNGVALARPYEFKYTYPSYSGTDAYPAKYDSFKGSYQFSSLAQNPDYQPFCLDAWGSYQGNDAGKTRHTNLQSWPDQRGLAPDVDPAAWQLKRVVLPSGGEIHVQYEPDDYAYVQDQPATGLASLSTDGGDKSAVARTDFWLDPASAGVAVVPAGIARSPLLLARKKAKRELLACQQMLQQQYVGTTKKIFFKFLYKLVAPQRSSSDAYQQDAPTAVTNCNTDYVSGYVTLSDIQVDTVNLKLKLVLPKSNDWALPQNVCQDFVQTQRLGKLQAINGNCDPAQVGISSSEKDATKLVRQFVDWVARKPSLLGGGTNSSICAALQPTLSYFKIPLPINKRGGGLRVKRLLTFDRGTELDNQPVLYGSEYEYQAFDKLTKTWRSSGVATTEPGSMREENALVSYIPRLRQGDLQKVVSGPDRKQSEGPIGESLLPAASVGYSRVTTKNIHSGKSNPGYSISEFFTCKDAPMQWRMTPLASQRKYLPLYAGLVNLVTDQTWATQGFSIILNALHGQPKREATYAGSYADINQQAASTLISEQVYEYAGYKNQAFNPADDEQLLVQNEPETGGRSYVAAASATGQQSIYPGKQVEVTMAQRAVRDHLNEVSLEGDIQYSPLFFFAGILWITGMVSLNRNTADFYSHTTSKVIRYPAIAKRVISAHDGMRDTLENMVFDRYTGSPVAVRSSDGGRGAYWKQTVMASWVYPQLRGKAQNEGLVFLSPPTAPAWKTVQDAGSFYLQAKSSTASDCQWLASVCKGDVLALGQEDTPARAQEFAKALYFADAPDIARKRIRLYPYTPSGSAAPGAGDVSGVSIIFSGNANQLQMQAGSTTYHGSVRKDLNFTPTAPNLDASDPFALALKTAIGNLSSMASGAASAQSTFTLSNNGSDFMNVNVAGFADRIPAGSCPVNLSKSAVKDMTFIAYYDAKSGSLRLQLMSFKIACSTGAGASSGYINVN